MSCDCENGRAPAVTVMGVVSVDHGLELTLHTCLCGGSAPQHSSHTKTECFVWILMPAKRWGALAGNFRKYSGTCASIGWHHQQQVQSSLAWSRWILSFRDGPFFLPLCNQIYLSGSSVPGSELSNTCLLWLCKRQSPKCKLFLHLHIDLLCWAQFQGPASPIIWFVNANHHAPVVCVSLPPHGKIKIYAFAFIKQCIIIAMSQLFGTFFGLPAVW